METSQREKELLLEIERLKYMVQLEEKRASHKKEKSQFEKDYELTTSPWNLLFAIFCGVAVFTWLQIYG